MDAKILAVSIAAAVASAWQANSQEPEPVPACTVSDNVVPGGRRRVLAYARELFDRGIYTKARELFQAYPEDPVAQGYSVFCDIRQRMPGHERKLEEYAALYPYSGMVPQLRYAYALGLFDVPDYAGAAAEFAKVEAGGLYRDQIVEYTYKKAYSDFCTGAEDAAIQGFMEVLQLPGNDYHAPAAYSAAYICYGKENFTEAEKLFAEAGKDPRFAEVSSYYIMECRFMNKDYRYVTGHAAEMYASVPAERKARLARIISEAYLVQGDVDAAKEYYDMTDLSSGTGRSDCFYAGSLLYAIQDYRGAIEKYGMMTDRTDSLGQIANYQMGYSYVQVKNKVAAMQAFKDAASVGYDADIQEDAYFNHAKLAFDLNNDPSVFDSYMKRYPELAKGDRIYSYMALAALYRRDYAAAVEAYDNIDVLDEDMKSNYMKANYLRAEQLISAGSWRNAVPCLKAAAYYSDKRTPFNQMSRYWQAESSYRADDFTGSAELFRTLYNTSALDGREEGKLLPYNIAYCHFKSEDYPSAEKWFSIYLESGDGTRRRDALTRIGDTYFIRKDYNSAVASYEKAISEYPQLDDLYPYYQAGVCYSLTDKQKDGIRLLSATRSASPDAVFWCETEYELGRAYMAADMNDSAREVFSSIAENGRDSTYRARALIGLGMIAANESQFDEALGHYRQVISSMPSTTYSEDALRAIEAIYQTKQEPEQYFAYLKTLSGTEKAADGDQESMFFNAAEQVFLAENYQKAISGLQAYIDEYPQGANVNLANFYMAESYKNIGRKEQACDWYRKVIDSGEGSYVEASALSFARLSYGMQRYQDAYSGYQALLDNAKIENNRLTAEVGMMNSAYAGKDYGSAIAAAVKVAADPKSDEDGIRRAMYVEAKSYLATSEREKAFSILKELSSATTTPEGAEAAYLMAQDAYDQGLFGDVETLVYKFSDSGTTETYWLAKAFIVLGDSFAERDEMKQAKATFESIRDGYKPQNAEDEVLDNVNMRLEKLAGITE